MSYITTPIHNVTAVERGDCGDSGAEPVLQGQFIQSRPRRAQAPQLPRAQRPARAAAQLAQGVVEDR